MLIETSVFHLKNRLNQGRGNVSEIRPGQPSAVMIDPHFMDDLTVPIQEQGLRFFIGAFHLFKGRKIFSLFGRDEINAQPQEKEDQKNTGIFY